jgi:serine/tyrosine/threonine adenylyltransferase
LLAQWMNVGFIHGVMNTDNMTLSGETIDYGPCAFMEAYDPQAVFSSIDHGGRYAYDNQPRIARWNLARLAEALLPLIAEGEDEAATQRAIDQVMATVIDAFPAWYDSALRDGQRAKLGLTDAEADDAALADAWLALLHIQAVDFTQAWRRLADAAAGDEAPLRALFGDAAPLQAWLAQWQSRCARDPSHATGAARAAAMRRVNPVFIPRNHRVEEALAAASERGDLQPFQQLLAVLQRPFDDDPAQARWAEPAPPAVTAGYRTFCGT